MYSKPIALLKEDDAVSPVIGVILMVAITVILAAVIAAFVLGIGDTDDVAPTTTFDSSFGEDVEIEVVSGDAIVVEDFELRGGDGNADWDCTPHPQDENVPLHECSDQNEGDTVDVGETFTLEFTGDGEVDVNLVWVGDGEDIIKQIEGDVSGN